MQTSKERNTILLFIPLILNFFVMGFVDIVGVATNYVKEDFALSDGMASLLPMMVFIWFAICSIPTGILMGKLGRKNIVLLSLFTTALAMLIPLLFYSYFGILLSFAFLGIGNTMLQVSLNPLVTSLVRKEKLTSILTMGQFIKAISSFLGPILVAFSASRLGDWRLTFLLYCIASVISIIALYSLKIKETAEPSQTSTSFRNIFSLLKDSYFVYCIVVILLIVGIDVSLNTNIPPLLVDRLSIPLAEATLGTSFYFISKTIGTFIGAFLLVKISPIKFLKASIWIAALAFITMMFSSSFWGLLISIAIVGLACANVFSIIFSLALQHDIKRANEIAALMIMGISGGALITPLQGFVTDQSNFTVGLSVILLCIFIIGSIAFKFKQENLTH
ncbi:MFS transporter [Sphingobacterium hungaricum]